MAMTTDLGTRMRTAGKIRRQRGREKTHEQPSGRAARRECAEKLSEFERSCIQPVGNAYHKTVHERAVEDGVRAPSAEKRQW